MIKSRHSTVVEQSVRGISHPVRGVTPSGGNRLRRIQIQYTKAITAKSLSFFGDVMPVLKSAYEKELQAFTSGKAVKTGEVFNYNPEYSSRCGCSECETVKQISEGEADRIRKRFREIFGAALDDKLSSRAKELLLQIMDSGKVNPKESKALMQDMYFQTIVAAQDDAYDKARTEWLKQPKEWRDENPFEGKKTSFFDKNDAFVKKIYANGYDLVSHAVTVENLSAIREIMNNGLNAGLSWDQTARLLNSRIGVVVDPESGLVRGGGISHWQRLVRTEMASAIDKAHDDRYRGMGVQWVRMSVSPSACPICQFYASINRGFYPVDEAPDITEDTHPNCTCVFVPYWNLPRGVDENQSFVDYPG